MFDAVVFAAESDSSITNAIKMLLGTLQFNSDYDHDSLFD